MTSFLSTCPSLLVLADPVMRIAEASGDYELESCAAVAVGLLADGAPLSEALAVVPAHGDGAMVRAKLAGLAQALAFVRDVEAPEPLLLARR